MDEIIYLAGEKYRRHLIKFTPNSKVPMAGMQIGTQLKFLKNAVSVRPEDSTYSECVESSSFESVWLDLMRSIEDDRIVLSVGKPCH